MLEWTKPSKPGSTRCPYCVEGSEFRLMQRLPEGEWVCPSCGHAVLPSSENFECTCSKCYDLATKASARRVSSGAEGRLQSVLNNFLRKK